MSDNVPRLTGGILFGLILEARKARTRVRRRGESDKNDGLTEVDIMLSLLEILGEPRLKLQGKTFKKHVSNYKKCAISTATYLPFSDQTLIDSFKNAVEQNKKEKLESMSTFISEKFSEQKLKNFVSAVVKTICQDETIDNSERFKISNSESATKKELSTNRKIEVEIELFLLDVMRYIFANKIDNTLGKSTFETWYSQAGTHAPWKFNNTGLWEALQELEIIRYNSKIEQTDNIEESLSVEEVHTDDREKFNSNTETDKSIKQQMLNNPKVINQYSNFSQQALQQNADSIYNIEQANNVNNIVNYAPARSTLSPNDYYNLFIIYGEQYEGDSFTIENSRIFEYTNAAIKHQFSQFTLEDIDEITSLPTLFLPEYSDVNQDIKTGFLGKLVDIDKRTGYTKLDFHKECEIELDSVVLHQSDLKLENQMELSRTHWAIKRANLINILESLTNGNETE